MAKVPPKRHFKIIRSCPGCRTTPDGIFGMKTITSVAISSVLFLLSESLIAGERGGGVGFGVPLPQQSVNPAPSQSATSRAPIARTPRPQRGPHLPSGGNGNVQPANGNPAPGSQGSVGQGGPNRHPGQNGNQNPNPNQHHHQKLDNNPQNPPITSATPPPPRHDWHDSDWYRRHCPVIVIVVGSYYYWDAGYWYPAYG